MHYFPPDKSQIALTFQVCGCCWSGSQGCITACRHSLEQTKQHFLQNQRWQYYLTITEGREIELCVLTINCKPASEGRELR